MTGRTLQTFIWLSLCLVSFGQEVPKIIHFTTEDYQALNQNWDIDQAPDHQMYFGNSAGMLTYDGTRWRTLQTPFNQIVRTVYNDGKGRTYVGGFATMGYWHINEKHEEEYVSLTDLVEDAQIAGEEIWHIHPLANGLLFQSFSRIYKYDFKKMEVEHLPGNIMFCQEVNGRLIVPVIGKGLFEFKANGSFELIRGSEIFSGERVATILPYGDGKWLVCTQKAGVWLYEDGQFSNWDTPVNERLKALQLNKALRLSDGKFVFGTILSGIFITDAKGNTLHQINQENGLQNNTVLALFEDRMNMLWVGLDKGIDLIDLNSPLLYYRDKSGQIGTVYVGAFHHGRLYVGTNQGVFHKKFPNGKEPFELLSGSQGQVWDLQVLDGQLLGCHNAGVFCIKNGNLEFLDSRAGAFNLAKHPNQEDVMVVGTYIGITVMQKNNLGEWQLSHRLSGYPLPVRKLFFDEKGKIWALHPRKGLSRLTLDVDLLKVQHIENFGAKHGLISEFGLDIEKIGKDIYVKNMGELFLWHEKKGQMHLGQFKGEYMRLGGLEGEEFLIFPEKVILRYENGQEQYPVSLHQSNGCVLSLTNDLYFFCVDEGYALLPRDGKKQQSFGHLPKPLITQITVNENDPDPKVLWGMDSTLVFHSSERHLRFYFTQPLFSNTPSLRNRLVGFEQNWTAFGNATSREFTNLNPGEYEFQVQSEFPPEIASISISIEPLWHQTVWAGLVFFLLLVMVLALLYHLHHYRLKRHLEKLEREKAKELQRQRTESENRILQTEVLNKSRKLADTTMSLVRKNETLMKINEELVLVKREKSPDLVNKKLKQLTRLVEGHIANEEDWKVFEETFNQLHDQFFKRLKEQFPDLTPGDFRLAAYLKMNLSSKEIAPLLNISLRGVENKRYRLRRKLGLTAADNLTEFFMQF